MSAESVEERRAKRKAEAAEAAKVQREKDLEAIDALEVDHGDSNIDVVEIPHTPGLPVLLAVRTPTEVEMKRYRATVKPGRDGAPGDSLKATSDLAAVCVVYPDKDLYKKVLAARPGVDASVGLAAVKLCMGKAESEGKG